MSDERRTLADAPTDSAMESPIDSPIESPMDSPLEYRYPGDAVDPNDVHLFHQPAWSLRLTVGNVSFARVKVVRAAPLSLPDQFITFLDDRDQEICMVEHIGALPAASRAIAESELTARYLTSLIVVINDVRNEFGTSYWDVDTHRGHRDFVVQNIAENARWLSSNRLLLVDVDGNRFEIPAIDALDKRSAGLISQAV
jgi:hypothetical protein